MCFVSRRSCARVWFMFSDVKNVLERRDKASEALRRDERNLRVIWEMILCANVGERSLSISRNDLCSICLFYVTVKRFEMTRLLKKHQRSAYFQKKNPKKKT